MKKKIQLKRIKCGDFNYNISIEGLNKLNFLFRLVMDQQKEIKKLKKRIKVLEG